MDIYILFMTSAVALGITLLGIFWSPSPVGRRMVPLFGLLLAMVGATGLEHLGKPRPLASEWREIGEAPVVAHVIDEPRAIYLLLAGTPPRLYEVPYSESMHQKLKDAEAQRGEEGFTILKKAPGAWSPPAVSAERPFDDVRKEGAR